jgi:hypothetical protein
MTTNLHPISSKENTIYADDVVARASYLRNQYVEWLETLETLYMAHSMDEQISARHDYNTVSSEFGEDEHQELAILEQLHEEMQRYSSDYAVRGDYFIDHIKQTLREVYPMPSEDVISINWEATAEGHKADYHEVEFDGKAFFVRIR